MLCRPFPWPTEVFGHGPGEAELGMGGDGQPGPAVRRGRVAKFRSGPAKVLHDHSEGMFKIESPQKRLPEPVPGPRRQQWHRSVTTTATPAWDPGPRAGGRPGGGPLCPR